MDKQTVAKVCEMYADGVHVRDIAKAISYSEPAVYRTLRDNWCSKPGSINLACWLKKHGITVETCAMDIGISVAALHRIIKGGSTRKTTIDKLLTYTGMTYEECFSASPKIPQ